MSVVSLRRAVEAGPDVVATVGAKVAQQLHHLFVEPGMVVALGGQLVACTETLGRPRRGQPLAEGGKEA